MEYLTEQSKVKLANSLAVAGDLAYRAGQFQQAMSNYQRAQKIALENQLHRTLIQVLIRTSICLQALGRYADAEDALHEAWSNLNSDSVNSVTGCRKLLARMYHEWSVLYWRMGKTDLSIQFNEKALEVADEPDNLEQIDELKVLILNHAALLSSKTGRPQKAQALLEKASMLVPLNGDSGKDYFLYGQLLVTESFNKLAQADYDDATKLFERGILSLQLRWGASHPKVKALFKKFAKELGSCGQGALAEQYDRRA